MPRSLRHVDTITTEAPQAPGDYRDDLADINLTRGADPHLSWCGMGGCPAISEVLKTELEG